ncbi:MAG: insulinase family protein [Deltaproteobacteria bacterium]|nr:MAG: insulinase family protein [Deltaproteobacteria bacterium]
MKATLSVAALLVTLAARGGRSDELPPVRRATLDNGLRLVVSEYHELPLVEFYVMVGAGAAQDPPGKAGLAALTATTLRRGAGSLSAEALARAVDSLGGRLDATAGIEATVVSAEFLAKDFSTGLDLLTTPSSSW